MKTKILIFLYFFIFQNWTSANDQNQTFFIKNFCIFATIPGTNQRQQNGETKFRVKNSVKTLEIFYLFFTHSHMSHESSHQEKNILEIFQILKNEKK
jgi:hypothetical protein